MRKSKLYWYYYYISSGSPPHLCFYSSKQKTLGNKQLGRLLEVIQWTRVGGKKINHLIKRAEVFKNLPSTSCHETPAWIRSLKAGFKAAQSPKDWALANCILYKNEWLKKLCFHRKRIMYKEWESVRKSQTQCHDILGSTLSRRPGEHIILNHPPPYFFWSLYWVGKWIL